MFDKMFKVEYAEVGGINQVYEKLNSYGFTDEFIARYEDEILALDEGESVIICAWDFMNENNISDEEADEMGLIDAMVSVAW